MTTTNKPMTGEQLDELMTVSVNMQRESEKLGDRAAAIFAYAVQVAVLELRSVRNVAEQLAAENAALREYRPQPSGAAMMEALDAFYEYHEDVPEQGMMAAFEILCCKRPETPATDAFLAEVRACGVDYAIGVIKVCANNLCPGGTGEAVQYAQEMVTPYLDSIHDKLADKSAQLRQEAK